MHFIYPKLIFITNLSQLDNQGKIKVTYILIITNVTKIRSRKSVSILTSIHSQRGNPDRYYPLENTVCHMTLNPNVGSTNIPAATPCTSAGT